MTSDRLTDPLAETVAVFEGVGAGTPLTTNEVTQQLDVGRRTI
jgi:hypothetical protein